MTFSKGLAPSQSWPPKNIRQCKWIPASAGMKRSGGDTDATEETDFTMSRLTQEKRTKRSPLKCTGKCMKRSIQQGSMKHSIRERKGIRAICEIRGFVFMSLSFSFGSIFDIRNSTVRYSLFGFPPCPLCLCVASLLSSIICLCLSSFPETRTPRFLYFHKDAVQNKKRLHRGGVSLSESAGRS